MELFQEILFALFAFGGGFGMFLYGMHTMAEGLQKSAVGKMKKLLNMLTKNRFLAVTIGALITAIIQSSSATTVMIVGFVNAGIMNLTQAVGVIMGANIGTTITSWIISSSEWAAFLKPKEIAPLAILIGAMLLFFSRKSKYKQVGEIIIGFGLIFIGLEFMGGAIEPYRESAVFFDAFRVLGRNPLLGVLAGAVVTAIIQSSSASVGILQTLAANGLVPWNAAVYIILGQNIGTCVTALLSSIGTSKTAKRAAIIHLLFNLIGTVLFFAITYLYFTFFNKALGSTLIDITSISIFHTIFNIASTLVLFPFANQMVRLATKFIPGTDQIPETESEVALRHLDERILETPSFAVENAIKEVVRMGYIVLENTKLSVEALLEKDGTKIQKVKEVENDINRLEHLIIDYLIKISNTSLTDRQQLTVTHLYSTVSDIESVGDHALNIAELAEYSIGNDIVISEIGSEDLIKMTTYSIKTYEIALQAREKGDLRLVHKVEDREENVDEMEEDMRNSHIMRLANYSCDPKASIVFLDTISNCERISDHALNIVGFVQDEVEV